MNENPILYDVVEIIQYLKKLKTKEEKKEYLLFLKEELSDICFYYTDDGIEKYLEEHKLTDKYKPEKYNQYADFDRTHISKSKYRGFLRDLEKILEYIKDQMVDNYLDEKRNEMKIDKDYKTFNYNVQKVLDYSNELGKDNIKYLAWILNDYYHSTIDRMNKGMPIPENNGKYISDATVIMNSEFFIKIKHRLELLQKNPNLKIFNSYTKAAEDLKKMKLEDISARNKELHGFNFDKIKEHANNTKDLNERLLYLLRVKKEETQIKGIIKKDFLGLSFEEKLNAEIEYVKEEIKIRLNKNTEERNNINGNKKIKSNTDKKNLESDETIEELRKKIIIPKGYDISNLAEYYIECMKRKQGLPSERDLAKSGVYNRYKWSKLLKKPEFIIELWAKLHILKKNGKLDKTKWYDNVYNYWLKKFAKAEKYEHEKKSKAKEYNDNILSEEY